MTESEWLAGTNPYTLITTLAEKDTSGSIVARMKDSRIDRRFRLFSVACGQRIEERMPDVIGKVAIGMAERIADGEVTEAELKSVHRAVWKAWDRGRNDERSTCLWLAGWISNWRTVHSAYQAASGYEVVVGKSDVSGSLLCNLIRDIFNPFRVVAVDPKWLSSTAVSIATGVYDDKAFDRLPILADALQDAGCENEDILNHLRSPGPHVRGCWALDLVLGKS